MSRTLIVFVFLGPIAGSLGFVIADQAMFVAGVSVSSLARPESAVALWKTIPILWLYSLALAYPIGFLPAIFCGFLYEKFLRKKLFASIYSGLLGLGISTVFGSMFIQFSSSGGARVHLVRLLAWGLAGFLGGLLSARVERAHKMAVKRGATL